MGRILMESLISPLTPWLFDAVEKVKVNFIYIIIVINQRAVLTQGLAMQYITFRLDLLSDGIQYM